MMNLHKAYYKDYFSNIDFSALVEIDEKGKNKIEEENEKKISDKNELFVDKVYTQDALEKSNPPYLFLKSEVNKDNDIIELEVQYPGLVTGIGIDHEANIKREFKLGVHFDWTYGMPVVYGSSVKGVLKSAFKDGYVDNDFVQQANKKIQQANKKNKDVNGQIPEWVGNEANRNAIIRGIFEGKDAKGENLSVYKRDIFFDVVIVMPDTKGRILCSDSITPHGDNPLKNPIPITFLKIAPGCTLEFRFKLTDSDCGDGKTLTATHKKTLFKEILTTVGIGAKTNVGYGQLKETKMQ